MVRVIAHRGASAVWPEHTRAAYLRALADGADGLECDVRLTADGVAVCWHDETVDRTSSGTGPVAGYTLADLRALDVLAGHRLPPGLGAPGEQVLTLAELVDLATGAGRPVHLAVEIKRPGSAPGAAESAALAVLDACGALGDGPVQASLMGFHPASLAELSRRGAPAERLMALLEDPVADDDLAGGATSRLAHGHARAAEAAALVEQARGLVDDGVVRGVGPSVAYVRSHPDRVAAWVRAGRTVRVWTVATAEDLAVCRAVGAQEATTDDPAAVLAMLGR